ncbi:hypothetical protein [Pseudovibrio sp. WM33]|uniref:hypothetical protein n=1 Tax=Pseudovibrio sp. WM33 TaxID=1735585 RepID=UPI0007AEC009|nr:hypothetical protein [Pseudovibrio sp. WM33]KZL23001.1 hypothetical protein PsWM33_03185 [Pseudovibrio sp. WM33]
MKPLAILSASAVLFIHSSGLVAVAQVTGDGPPVPTSKSLQSDIHTLAETGSGASAAKAAEQWLGKSLNFAWTITKEGAEAIEEKFTTFICNSEALAWNTTSKLGKSKGSATYTVQQITPEITQFSWKDNPQESNLGWVWTLDAASGKAYGVVINSQPYENLSIEGEFAVLPVLTEEEKNEFTCP